MNRTSTIESSRRLDVILVPRQVVGGFVRHACIIRRVDGSEHVDATLWYELPADLPQIAADDAEPFLLASIMDAMQENRSIHIGGRVSRQLLSNLQEFMVAWSRWQPGTFRVVPMAADSITNDPASSGLEPDSAVTAHTGGLDALSTIYRHAHQLEGHRNRRITACVVVHGFLISLEQKEKFDHSFQLAQNSLNGLGLKAYPLRTNLADVVRTHWSNVYGVAIVSALQFFKPLGKSCLTNAPKPYEDLLFPRGSNPLTDALLSSDSLQVMHDGCGLDRLEKTRIVAQWPEAVRNLRVCWKGRQVEANCGACEECVRTKLGFLALGEDCPPLLGTLPTPWQILSLEAMNEASRADFRQILEYCERHDVNASWVRALGFRVRSENVYRKVRHWRWRARRLSESLGFR